MMLVICYADCMIYRYASPFGPISYAWDGEICSHIWLAEHDAAQASNVDPVSQWLDGYFNRQVAPLPALAKPATPFQQKMRDGLLAIAVGQVRTYGQLASQLGSAPRAMGQALGANPLPILIPCHRIVAANGLGGFACGLAWKKKLLGFERKI